MLELLKALKHCHNNTSCIGCPYEQDKEKCDKMFINIENIFTKIGEFIDFDDIQNIIKIIVKKRGINSESKNSFRY